MDASAWPERLIDEYAKRLRGDPKDLLASYFLDIANHTSSSAPSKAKRYRLGYVSVVVRMIFFLRRMFLADAARISTGTVNAVWLDTPAHADTMKAFLGRDSPEREKTPASSIGFAGKCSLFVVLGSLPQVIDIFVRLLRSAPRPLRNRVEFFEFLLQVICYMRLPSLQAAIAGPCVLTYEAIAINKAVALLTRRAGYRVIHVIHGLKHPNFQVSVATDLVLLSKIDEAWFRERVSPDARLWTIGHPRLESIRREVGPPDAWQRKRLPRIAFFSQPSEGDYDPELRMQDWRTLAGLKDRAEVRFRLHPRENRDTAALAIQRCGLEFVELSNHGLKEDLAWCDAVASSWSTVSMEAAACGRGVFWTCSTPERYEVAQELRDHGVGVLIGSPGEWRPYLDEWACGPWNAPVVVTDERLRELGFIGTGEQGREILGAPASRKT